MESNRNLLEGGEGRAAVGVVQYVTGMIVADWRSLFYILLLV